jgi:hypothetical protein
MNVLLHLFGQLTDLSHKLILSHNFLAICLLADILEPFNLYPNIANELHLLFALDLQILASRFEFGLLVSKTVFHRQDILVKRYAIVEKLHSYSTNLSELLDSRLLL